MCKIFEDYGKEIAEKSLLANLKTLMETMHFTLEQAMDALRVPSENRADITSKITIR